MNIHGCSEILLDIIKLLMVIPLSLLPGYQVIKFSILSQKILLEIIPRKHRKPGLLRFLYRIDLSLFVILIPLLIQNYRHYIAEPVPQLTWKSILSLDPCKLLIEKLIIIVVAMRGEGGDSALICQGKFILNNNRKKTQKLL